MKRLSVDVHIFPAHSQELKEGTSEQHLPFGGVVGEAIYRNSANGTDHADGEVVPVDSQRLGIHSSNVYFPDDGVFIWTTTRLLQGEGQGSLAVGASGDHGEWYRQVSLSDWSSAHSEELRQFVSRNAHPAVNLSFEAIRIGIRAAIVKQIDVQQLD